MSAEREAAFIEDVLALGRHYDKAIGYTRFKGGALQFQGFQIMKLREFEAVATKHGKRFTYWLHTTLSAVAVDDVDGPPISPTTIDEFSRRLVGSPTIEWGPEGGSVRSAELKPRQVGSAIVRNLMASKAVLDVWARLGRLTIWTLPQSQITNGLFEQIQKSLVPQTPTRRQWRARPKKLRKKRSSNPLGTRSARRTEWKKTRRATFNKLRAKAKPKAKAKAKASGSVVKG